MFTREFQRLPPCRLFSLGLVRALVCVPTSLAEVVYYGMGLCVCEKERRVESDDCGCLGGSLTLQER